MDAAADQEPDPRKTLLRVGQDAAGHWLVQQGGGGLEGRFISLAAAMAFARAERQSIPGASIVRTLAPLTPAISFAPVQPWEMAHKWSKAA